MFPWLARNQWHAFSIYENALDPSIRHMFMANIGDWTKEMHKVVGASETARPLWITGPFPSPYSNALAFDNLICVASGIGITPAVSAIEAYKESRRVNLLWACRDASMLVFFLENAKLDYNAFNLVFFTGKAALPDMIENYNVSHNAHLKIIKKRPNLSWVIPNIIRAIDVACDNGKDLIPRYSEVVKEKTSAPKVEKEVTKVSTAPSIPEGGDGEDAFPTNVGLGSFEMPLGGSSAPKVAVKTARGSVMLARTNIAEFAFDAVNNKDDLHSNGSLGGSNAPRKARKARASVWNTNSDLESNSGNRRQSTFEANVGAAGSNLNVWEEQEGAKDYVLNTMPKANKDQWSFLYCGGINPLLGALVAESKELNLPLHQEAFNW
jgi:hypothetical protein